MRQVIVGYGEFKDYRLQEIPESFLKDLAGHFPLTSSHHTRAEWEQLFITVAVHEELQRRQSGGMQLKRRPTKKQLAAEIVTKGFHSLSKAYHPDRNGDNETQRMLTEARDLLQTACRDLEEEHSEDVVFIKASSMIAEITDEDIPF